MDGTVGFEFILPEVKGLWPSRGAGVANALTRGVNHFFEGS